MAGLTLTALAARERLGAAGGVRPGAAARLTATS